MEDEEKIEDTTSEDEESDFEDDLDNAFGEEEDMDGEEDDDKGGDSDKDKDKDKDKKSEKKQSSAVIQKQKYREKLKAALKTIDELKGKKDTQGQLTDEQKKELAAEEYLAKTIKKVLGDIKHEEESSTQAEEEAFQEELDDILEDRTDLTEKQILDVCEELDVSPKQALKVIDREKKLKGKEKPKLPQSNRGKGDLKEDDDKGSKKTPLSYEAANRSIKDKIKKGIL